MSQSNANTWVHLLHPVLNHTLADQELLPARTAPRRCRDVHDELDGPRRDISPFFHAATERPIQRPQDPEEPQEYDSGKNKGHTLKNLLVMDETCHMGFLSATYEGKRHDKTMAELVG